MLKQELKEYLKENLKIRIDMQHENSKIKEIRVKILLEGEVISSDYDNIYPEYDMGPG
jgi:hypothetical protein